VRYLSDRIAVLYLGRLMELGDAETVFTPAHHPYTEALLSSVPQAEGETRERIRLQGEIPSHGNPPSGCVFHTRCPRYIGDICHQQEPELKEVEPGHFWRCHYSVEELRELQKSVPEQRSANGSSEPAGRSREQAHDTRAETDSEPSGERPPDTAATPEQPAAEAPPVSERPPDVEGTPGERPPGGER
jgi:oligopeptide/dipeptide ABC transporter ATP-binding protein